jgi:hypothetical protein
VGQVGDDQGFHGKSPWMSVWLVEAFDLRSMDYQQDACQLLSRLAKMHAGH